MAALGAGSRDGAAWHKEVTLCRIGTDLPNRYQDGGIRLIHPLQLDTLPPSHPGRLPQHSDEAEVSGEIPSATCGSSIP